MFPIKFLYLYAALNFYCLLGPRLLERMCNPHNVLVIPCLSELMEQMLRNIQRGNASVEKTAKCLFNVRRTQECDGGVATSRQSSDVVVATNIRRFKRRHLPSQFVSSVSPEIGIGSFVKHGALPRYVASRES